MKLWVVTLALLATQDDPTTLYERDATCGVFLQGDLGPMKDVIVCAAIRHPKLGYTLPGVRHAHCFHLASSLFPGAVESEWEQGFLDRMNRFLSREEAHKVAKAAGQIVRRCGGDEEALYSENLY